MEKYTGYEENYEKSLEHFGTPRHSGRYPWGSGDDPYQHEAWNFLKENSELKKEGLTEAEIAKAQGCESTSQLRALKSLYTASIRSAKVRRALELKEEGYSNVEIGKKMAPYNGGNPIPESTIRPWLEEGYQERVDSINATADKLIEKVGKKNLIDVGIGVEKELGISETKLKDALQLCIEKGYVVENIKIPQASDPSKKTTIRVLAPEGTTVSDIYKNKDKIKSVECYSQDNGKTYFNIESPRSIDSKRVYVRYAEDGGKDLDGVIYIRPGVDDIALNGASYAQVRIAVDGTHYMKGMAIYSNDIPKGYDIAYNTNKHKGAEFNDVFKPMKTVTTEDGKTIIDPDNPFGAEIKNNGGQWHYTDKNGKDQLSLINKIKDEGDWAEYSKSLASQFLGKQPDELIKRQLDAAKLEKQDEYNDILKVSNPTIRKELLMDFADNCDKAAVDLKAAPLPRQATQVILPVPTLKDNEIYAPNYRNGEQVALVRYPHGGIFEIPILTVNNNHKEASELIGQAVDAVGINSAVASQLSGADFDGDTVVVIPTNANVRIRNKAPLEGLKDFDTKRYKFSKEELEASPKDKNGDPKIIIAGKTQQTMMGKVSNLITDMTLQGADDAELERAVKHSMVVIDAKKHKLNYKASEEENNIADLKRKYQGGANKGASTLLSRSSGPERIPERKEGVKVTDPITGKTTYRYIDPETGEKLYTETGRTYIDKKGKVKIATQEIERGYLHDAGELSSGTEKEEYYVNYSRAMKALANTARKEYLATPDVRYSPSAKEKFKSEVGSLTAKLNTALKNAPRERQAQLIANKIIKNKKKDAERSGKELSDEDIKKIRSQAISYGRSVMGAKKESIDITEREWEAINAGAVSANTLTKIIANTKSDKLKSLAMPRNVTSLTTVKKQRIKNMYASGMTMSEIADAIGVSVSTVSSYVKSKD